MIRGSTLHGSWYRWQVIELRPYCEDFVSWLSGSGAALEDPARWAGVLIAFLGALVANPDATAHRFRMLRRQIQNGWSHVQGRLARWFPRLRRDAVMHTGSAHLNLGGGGVSAFARGFTPLVKDATAAEKIEALDKRTLRLHDEIGELQAQLRKSRSELRGEIASTASDLRREIAQTREAIEELDRQTIHSDASALPVIVLGVVLSGLSADADAVPMWGGLLVLTVFTVISVALSWQIFSALRPGR